MKKLICLSFILQLSFSHASTLIVEMDSALTPNELKVISAKYSVDIELFDNIDSEYFQRTYKVEGRQAESISEFPKVRKVEGVFEASHFSLTPAKNSKFLSTDNLFHFQWGLHNQG